MCDIIKICVFFLAPGFYLNKGLFGQSVRTPDIETRGAVTDGKIRRDFPSKRTARKLSKRATSKLQLRIFQDTLYTRDSLKRVQR